eukprot:TRINITY_DN38336_c0_g1_i1.p1 TRINITY_DN38336_c0_g1~~TRINITY_DN38336_c0_g1_i1.p1  ORF type:complete len:663 (-),score=111.56 TRINITY_DN38336_c0_g1_i1:74-2062(-)
MALDTYDKAAVSDISTSTLAEAQSALTPASLGRGANDTGEKTVANGGGYSGVSVVRDTSGVARGDEPWTCAICCESLGVRLEEIGALTFQGRRVEQALYHGGCVAMMLLHEQKRNAPTNEVVAGPAKAIVWGSSPVTRRPVDSFMPMPSPSERQKWFDFLDWRSIGRFDVAELALVMSNLFSMDAGIATRLLLPEDPAEMSGDGTLSRVEVERALSPVLDREMLTKKWSVDTQPESAEEEEVQGHLPRTPFGAVYGGVVALVGKGKLLDVRPLRSVNSAGRSLARLILVHDICCLLTRRSQQPSQGKVCETVCLLSELVEGRDSTAFSTAIELVKDTSVDVRVASVKLLARAAYPGEQRVIQSLISQTADDAPSMRGASLLALGEVAMPSDARALRVVIVSLVDSNLQVRTDAESALERLAHQEEAVKMDVAWSLLLKQDPLLRRAAVKALNCIGAVDCTTSIDVMIPLLKNKEEEVDVRTAVSRTVARIASKCGEHQHGIEVLLPFLRDVDSQVQIATLKALVDVSPKGDPKVVREILDVISHIHKHCKATLDSRGQLPLVCTLECAMKVLAQVAVRGDARSCNVCRAVIARSHPRVERAAKQTLADLTGPATDIEPGSGDTAGGETDEDGGTVGRRWGFWFCACRARKPQAERQFAGATV